MFDYIEIAVGSPRNRGRLIAKKDLVKYINHDTPLFRSIYLYTKKAVDYAESNGGLKNYFGERAIDWILLDIDKADNSDEYTLNKARNVINQIDEQGVDINYSIQPYFSGSGYHLAIPNSVFNFPNSDNLHYLVKGTLKDIFGDVIDSSIFMRTGIYRVQHTINKKTDLYKIPLTVAEILNKDSETIKELAKNPRIEYAYSELVGNGELESKILARAPRMTQIRKVVEPKDVIPCVQEMLSNGPQEGSRNQTLLRIASHF